MRFLDVTAYLSRWVSEKRLPLATVTMTFPTEADAARFSSELQREMAQFSDTSELVGWSLIYDFAAHGVNFHVSWKERRN